MGRGWRAWVLGAALVAAGCGRRNAPTGAPSASDAGTSATSGSTVAWRVLGGRVPFLMVGKRQTLRGGFKDLRGDLQIDFSDLSRTRGSISADVRSLEMTTFLEADRNREQTADALAWLDVTDRAPVDLRERFRWATFTLRAITSAEPNDLTGGNGSVRRARLTALGDLSFHGHTVPLQATLEATAAFDGPNARNVLLRTVDDFTVSPEAHAVGRRSPAAYATTGPPAPGGKLVAKASELLEDKLPAAQVALEVALEPSDIKER